MSKSLNKVMIIGHVGGEIKQLQTSNDLNIVMFSVATNYSVKDKLTGEYVDKPEWHNVTAFRKSAEYVAKYLKKGDMVYVEGEIRTETYTPANSAEEKQIKKILAKDIRILTPKPKDDNNTSPFSSSGKDSYYDNHLGASYNDDSIPF